MDQLSVPHPEDTAPEERLRILDWLWHPWYAKVWWGAIAVFWAGALFLPTIGVHRLPLGEGIWMYVAVILHPQAALPVLGFGWARAFLRGRHLHRNVVADEHLDEDVNLFEEERFMVYLADPADSRSPLSSLNPACPRYIHRHDR